MGEELPGDEMAKAGESTGGEEVVVVATTAGTPEAEEEEEAAEEEEEAEAAGHQSGSTSPPWSPIERPYPRRDEQLPSWRASNGSTRS
ncbi:MAG: hypothetical protein ACR2PK_12270 [Acidimicrobiales bacterium]